MTSISKNVYIDKLDDIVNEYNNTYHRIIKMKPIDVKDNTYIDFGQEVHDKDPRFKLGQKKFLRSKKLKMQYHGHTLLIILMVKKLLEHFMKKNSKKQIKKNLGQKK